MKFDFHMPDALKKFKRKMAVILPKDVGAIIAYADIGKESIVVEVGAGNGFLTYYLSRIANRVYAYEIREDAFEILKYNMKLIKANNVILKNQDGKYFDEKDVDVVIADIPDAHNMALRAFENLKAGGFFVCFLPNIEQVKETCKKARAIFKHIFVLSTLHIDYKIDENSTRPENKGIVHTAYLLFAKK
ncbi:MAG: rRNA adenine N-6-methyltransferase family protein [Candidatus Anstonellales archaeon]